ncbi:hypothetical protein AN216_12830 [Streptomyces oceani]|uniref:Uncharacterized protein n=1 Tax=Streptomyces oceani TaxID=1075402 RepID=A0A1E7KH79_9ACTN|nr:hypothetical protein AN216_12830 [Streptomyces oceani]
MRAVADSVLYEGYLLYPYRRSSPKNRVRWQFGVLAPRDWVEADGPVSPGIAGSAESWYQQTECLLEPLPDAVVHARVRYLQLQRKSVRRRSEDGWYEPVDSLEVAGTLHLSFDEAVPREVDVVVPLAELLLGERSVPVTAPGGEETESLPDGAGWVVRRRQPVEARVTLSAERPDGPAAPWLLRVRTENTGRPPPGRLTRDEALRQALVATHTLIGGQGVEFVSLTDPPEWAARHAAGCRNVHTFPVLAGEEGSRELVLSAPIILPDHPRVAPESPGDLHDSAEIDEILSLRTLLLTDEEKREARATDQRAADILERVEQLPPEVFERLHGAIRSLRPAQRARPEAAAQPAREVSVPEADSVPPRMTTPWWEEGGDDGLSPATDSVLVDGVAVAKGSIVRLRPRKGGADAQDMFLAGRTAQVSAVFHDVDGSRHVAVTLEDDPAAELHSWYGRFRYFRPDEVQPLTSSCDDHREVPQPPDRPVP